jgi:hypothetical protein
MIMEEDVCDKQYPIPENESQCRDMYMFVYIDLSFLHKNIYYNVDGFVLHTISCQYQILWSLLHKNLQVVIKNKMCLQHTNHHKG